MALTLTAVVIFLSLAKSTSAQVYYRPRRRRMGSIIIGAIIAGIGLLLLICVAMLIMRRLRARRAYTANTGLPPPATSFGKTLFGGSWGRSDVNQHQGYAQPGPYGMQNMYHQGSMQAPQQNYGFEQNSAPPNYGSHGEDERETQDKNYASTLGPPPPAHTTNNFVGGFRT